MADAPLTLAGRTFESRLIIGTGKYPNFEVMKRCHQASGARLATVAVRRLDLAAKGDASLLQWVDRGQIMLLPNTCLLYTSPSPRD